MELSRKDWIREVAKANKKLEAYKNSPLFTEFKNRFGIDHTVFPVHINRPIKEDSVVTIGISYNLDLLSEEEQNIVFEYLDHAFIDLSYVNLYLERQEKDCLPHGLNRDLPPFPPPELSFSQDQDRN